MTTMLVAIRSCSRIMSEAMAMTTPGMAVSASRPVGGVAHGPLHDGGLVMLACGSIDLKLPFENTPQLAAACFTSASGEPHVLVV